MHRFLYVLLASTAFSTLVSTGGFASKALQAADPVVAILKTSKGEIKLELDAKKPRSPSPIL